MLNIIYLYNSTSIRKHNQKYLFTVLLVLTIIVGEYKVQDDYKSKESCFKDPEFQRLNTRNFPYASIAYSPMRAFSPLVVY